VAGYKSTSNGWLASMVDVILNSVSAGRSQNLRKNVAAGIHGPQACVATPGNATISWTPSTPGFGLQATWVLSPGN
jgi:hypothetical protein